MVKTDQQRQTININGHLVDLTSLNKPVWPEMGINKSQYLHYLSEAAEYMLPYLARRHLTVIRYPHGISGESFYQKNCPPYAPPFVQTDTHEGINYIVCADLATLIWLGNQLALEFHVPFQPLDTDKPSEIVFDLDPPHRKHFQLAVKAAMMMKDLFDKLDLKSFIKTSGNKGLQVYIPLAENTYTYEQTRLFTAFVARFLVSEQPGLFTIERLKKNRRGRLYIDYVQHAPGKTIIAPYSPRANPDALVATPLYWDEVDNGLRPEQFTLPTIPSRLKEKGCPFQAFTEVKDNQPFDMILEWIQKHQKA
ncbi:DNA polymerase LigD, polymerase domain protein [Caldalkalibacillus thermarum TA2.A1]|uniref:DNA polymerase LigD, polymerase domain protein n=1 Tax=Caldalkalibacillus thermarum (strain TA2.A1) TaxID=986075 RepID=F5L6D6_CALTT|nr:non-homologous end-joining DNA ligase [Caldalkalibacillus thermarum]EGL83089.1 DNA polymerase LigD, polymerase domain protein [Caldalkalibacillus thermarum TA2.A1]